jgi:hypothetical protein
MGYPISLDGSYNPANFLALTDDMGSRLDGI